MKTTIHLILVCMGLFAHAFGQQPKPAVPQTATGATVQVYDIQDSVLIKTKEGIQLSAIVVRKKGAGKPQPAPLLFTIYADHDGNLEEAKRSADHGYIGVVVNSRGKALGPDQINPYEKESTDVNGAVDWISKHPWTDGRVAIYGGSYSGFAAWAATKHLHPALKTIVPYVAAIPGFGLPMENNIFLSANYGWGFYVSNNKYLDETLYRNQQHWSDMQLNWYNSGAAYRKIDSIEGHPNPLLQRWIQHPSYDEYWQNMVPWREEFAKINIPVLSVTGYYDDGQISALRYFKEHYKYNKQANHYLIIGPYDHFGAQRGGVPVLRDYKVDQLALISTAQITYDWLDYVLKGGPKPALLKDKINYEVMGSNTWKHAPSIEKMNNQVLRLYLGTEKSGQNQMLLPKKPGQLAFSAQEVDFADRQHSNNNDYYPYPIVGKELDRSAGLYFISEPFNEQVSVDGIWSGVLKASINKKDMDIGMTLYEVMPDGRYFHLSYFLGRASYAKDMTRRTLLKEGAISSIPFSSTRMFSRYLSKGSRLLLVLDINKNPYAQINYGTGKDVSEESIADAKVPLKIRWYNDSYVDIPVWKY
jgi:putative CocE/NonD family hydrolase